MSYSAFVALAMENKTPESIAFAEGLLQRIEAEFGEAFYAPRAFPEPNMQPPAQALRTCEKAIHNSEVFFLYYPDHVVSGALMEVGYARAANIPVVVYTKDPKNLPYFLREGSGWVTILTDEALIWPTLVRFFKESRAHNLHKTLTESNSVIHVSVAGAGSELIRRLDVPGSTAYMAGSTVLTRRGQTHNFLGFTPEASYVCKEIAFDLAMESYIQAAEVKVTEGLDSEPVGLGIEAAVASTRIPRGQQEAHIVLITKNTVNYRHVILEKELGAGARHWHNEIIADVASAMLFGALLGSEPSSFPSEKIAVERFYQHPIFSTDGTRHTSAERQPSIYLPSTLNPIHEGHRAFCQYAEDELSPAGPGRVRATYLVSSVSPHKGRLSVQDMLFKAGMLRAERWQKGQQSRVVEFTHDEPFFLDKARKRPGSIFLIGADAMELMLDPKWEERMGLTIDDMLTEMKNLGTQFYVMGRVLTQDGWTKRKGLFTTCREIPVSFLHQNLFKPLPGRVDISSTQLREAAAQ